MGSGLEVRPFGKTGERTTVIGLGGGALAAHSLSDGVETVQKAVELGINYFDTAPYYNSGASQVIMGIALEGCSRSHILATKLGYLYGPGAYRSPDALRAQLWEDLRNLRRKQVDVLQVHLAELACWWEGAQDDRQLLDADKTYNFELAPVLQVLAEAKEKGFCRYIGITADHAAGLAAVLRHVEVDACLVAYNYNVLYRQARHNVLPLARKKGVAYIAAGIFKPLMIKVTPSWETTPPEGMPPELHTRIKSLYALQRESGLSLIEMGLRYILADRDISVVLVGAARPAEIEESVAAALKGPLPADLHKALDDLGLPE